MSRFGKNNKAILLLKYETKKKKNSLSMEAGRFHSSFPFVNRFAKSFLGIPIIQIQLFYSHWFGEINNWLDA